MSRARKVPLPVLDSRPEPPPRGSRLLSLLERPFAALERISARHLPAELDPIAQAGAVANVTFIVALVSGVLLLFFYVPSVTQAYSSLEAMRAHPLTAELIRSVHRYSSDACMLFVIFHAARYAFARRFTGARWLAWVTGVLSLGLLWFVGWLGYWLVWDERARQIAIGTARMLDVIPIFDEPMSRSFLTDDAVKPLLFFIVFFLHMIIPLGIGVALWLHVTRLRRPTWMTSKQLGAWILGSLVALSLVYPATSVDPAQMMVLPEAFSMDWWFLLPIVFTDRLGAGALWAGVLIGGVLLFSAPWWASRGLAPPASVDEARCNACERCAADCPFGAITMDPRTDDKDFSSVAKVDEARCVGCGVCAGSCDSAGIGLPWLDVAKMRQKMDGWLDAANERGQPASVAFLCASSAAAGLTIDPETGECDELPGYVAMAVPCAGWVHMLSVERALRHGAQGVLIVACAEGACDFEEGARFARERLDGAREPGLRTGVDGERIALLRLGPAERRALLRDASVFRDERTVRQASTPTRRTTVAAAILALSASLGVTALFSDLAYAPPASETELVVSFKHAGRAADGCREPTAEEQAARPAHMRAALICQRGRPPVEVRITVDGRRVHESEHEATGLFGDGPSIALVGVPIEEGSHRIEIALRERGSDGWIVREERTLGFEAGQRRVVRFEGGLLEWY